MSKDHSVSVYVFSPREPDPRLFEFDKTTKIGEAAAAAAKQFGYADGVTVTFAREDDTRLDRNKPLVAEGVREGDRLKIVDIGGGV